jgi:hypothetical protein
VSPSALALTVMFPGWTFELDFGAADCGGLPVLPSPAPPDPPPLARPTDGKTALAVSAYATVAIARYFIRLGVLRCAYGVS